MEQLYIYCLIFILGFATAMIVLFFAFKDKEWIDKSNIEVVNKEYDDPFIDDIKKKKKFSDFFKGLFLI